MGLWDPPAHLDERWKIKTMLEACRAAQGLIPELDIRVYGAGQRSCEALSDLGLQFTEIPHPGDLWSSKHRMLRAVLDDVDSAVWLDLDARMFGPLPDDFWPVLDSGPQIQTKLRQYKNRKCHWRSADQRKLPGGAWIYTRSRSLLERATEVIAEKQGWTDEIALAYAIDEWLGGWVGPDEWVARGFDGPFYTIRGEIAPAPRPLFTAS